MKKLNIKTVALDLEVQYAREYHNKDVSQHIFLIADYFEHQAALNNIRVLTYSFFSYVIKNRKIKKSDSIKNKLIYGFYVRHNTDKSKNLIYRR